MWPSRWSITARPLAKRATIITAARVTVARALYTAPTMARVHEEAQVPFMWFKQTGQEVSAPPDQQTELLPENFSEYRRRFSSEATFDYQAMNENVILFGTPDLVAERIESMRQNEWKT